MIREERDSGGIFGRLMLTGKSYKRRRTLYVETICICGKIKWVCWYPIRAGAIKSCGCLNRERLTNTKPTLRHGLYRHPLNKVWMSMKQRCYNIKNVRFRSYGGNGVVVCEEWRKSFKRFYEWAISNGWHEGLELDKDILYAKKFGTKTGKIYSPEFCCFVTRQVNSRTRSTSHYLEYNGIIKTMGEWCEETGVSRKVVMRRINKLGWSVEKTFSTPYRHR